MSKSLLRTNMVKLMELRNFSPKTIKAYLWAVQGLAGYYRLRPDRLTAQQVQDYLYYLIKERKLAWNTVHLAIYGIKFFFYDLLGHPKTKFYIPCPKTPKRLPVIWSPKEIAKLFSATSDLKIRTLLKTAYATGLRLNELVHLQVGDIDSGHMTIWVRQGKGKKDRAALLTPRLLHELRIYWKSYRPRKWLFPRKGANDLFMRPESLGAKFREVKRKAGFQREGGLHSIRHSFATHMIARGVDLLRVQKLLGHKNISTTMIYVHLAGSVVVAQTRNFDLLDLKPLKH